MTFDETLAALERLAGSAVAVDVCFTNTISAFGDMPPPSSDDGWHVHEGVLEVHETELNGSRAVDAAAWWERENKVRVRIHPEGGIIFSPSRFNSAHWENNVLVIQTGSIESRVVRLVRPAGTYVIRRPSIQLSN